MSYVDSVESNTVTAEEAFYGRILSRLLKWIGVLSGFFLIFVCWRYGWRGGLGFAAGSVVSYLNFHALMRGVNGLADRIVNRNSREKGGMVVFMFMLRYGLVGLGAYAIFKGSAVAFHGFLWGLCMPVAAMMSEAGFEAYAAFLRK